MNKIVIREKIRKKNIESGVKVIVLDDDPTGCQTVHDVVLSFFWDTETLKELIDHNDCFYLLTNSRALTGKAARKLYSSVSENILRTGYPADKIRIICRSDSTLRGHFFEETMAVFKNFRNFDGLLVIPFFKEGGRITKGDVHYVIQDGRYIPVSETEFARDPQFGYNNSYLPAWIEEKSKGYFKKEDALSISIEEIRTRNHSSIMKKIENALNGTPVIINSLEDSDIEYFCSLLQEAEDKGKRFLYRTGASFVKIRAGISDIPLYMPPFKQGAGLIIAGSFVNRTTEQLNHLLEMTRIRHAELSLDRIVGKNNENYLGDIIELIDESLGVGENFLIFTERKFRKTDDPENELHAGELISSFLSRIVAGLNESPGFIIAKGGITSHEIAYQGLGIKQATVTGQILPGVPVLKTGKDSSFPGIDFIIFPGNVGSKESLLEIVKKYSEN